MKKHLLLTLSILFFIFFCTKGFGQVPDPGNDPGDSSFIPGFASQKLPLKSCVLYVKKNTPNCILINKEDERKGIDSGSTPLIVTVSAGVKNESHPIYSVKHLVNILL